MAQILRWALEQPGFEDVFTRNEMYTMQPTNLQPVTRYFSQQDKMRIMDIIRLVDRCMEYQTVNTGVKHILGLLAVRSAAETRKAID